MHFFVWSKKCQETHQHCMLDRSAFYPQGVQCASPQKAWQKRLYHMVASRCKSHFSLLANGYRWTNVEIEQLANRRANIVTFSEWVAGTMVSRVRRCEAFCETNSTPQKPNCTPRNERMKSHSERWLANCEFHVQCHLCFPYNVIGKKDFSA